MAPSSTLSVSVHLPGRDDAYVMVAPPLDQYTGRFCDLVETDLSNARLAAATIGQLLSNISFPDRVMALTGCETRPGKIWPKTARDGARGLR